MPLKQKEAKLAELILYICQRSEADPSFGQTKLHKVLYFSDFNMFGVWGETITGAEYQHLPFGPGVKRMLPVQGELQSAGDLAIKRVAHYKYEQERPLALREADLSEFSGREIAMVDTWITRLWDKSAADVSYDSHETAGWRLTTDGELIDPKTVFLAWGEPSVSEQKRGLALAEHFGLLA